MGGCKLGSIVSLTDARQRGAQSQDVVAAFQQQLGGKLTPKRQAILVSSVLFERQIQRIDIPNQRMFTDEDQAMVWLLSPDEPA